MRYRIPKLIILALVVYAMVCMWHWKIGFTFFTQLSNLYMGLTVLLQLVIGQKKTGAMKFSALVSILVTFLVYLLVLAPLVPGGIMAAYREDHYASLCMHVLVPAVSCIDYWLNDRKSFRTSGWLVYALLPPVIWFAFILMIGAFGVRWHGMSAPYPFLNYLAPAGWFGWMPETAGYKTMGIGVAYTLVLMMGVFALVGWLVQRFSRDCRRCEAQMKNQDSGTHC